MILWDINSINMQMWGIVTLKLFFFYLYLNHSDSEYQLGIFTVKKKKKVKKTDSTSDMVAYIYKPGN